MYISRSAVRGINTTVITKKRQLNPAFCARPPNTKIPSFPHGFDTTLPLTSVYRCQQTHTQKKRLTGRFVLNLARTTPLVPCARHTLPHTTRYFVPFFSVFACSTVRAYERNTKGITRFCHPTLCCYKFRRITSLHSNKSPPPFLPSPINNSASQLKSCC